MLLSTYNSFPIYLLYSFKFFLNWNDLNIVLVNKKIFTFLFYLFDDVVFNIFTF